MASRSAGGLGNVLGYDVTVNGPFDTYNVHKTRAYRKNRQSQLATIGDCNLKNTKYTSRQATDVRDWPFADAEPLFRPRSSCSTRRIKDPRAALYDPNRFGTSYYLEVRPFPWLHGNSKPLFPKVRVALCIRESDVHPTLSQDPPEMPGVAGKEQWKRLSSKWNQTHNLPASSRQKRRPQSSQSYRPDESYFQPNQYNATGYTPQSTWRSQRSQRSQGRNWRDEAREQQPQRPKAVSGKPPTVPLISHLNTERSNKNKSNEKELFFRSIESENWQVTPDIIKENLECDRLLRTASWEAQAAETALTMQRFIESDQHLRRASKLQEAAESLSNELDSRSKARYPTMTTMKHDYTIRQPLLHGGGYSRPFNAECFNADTLDPMGKAQ